MIIAMIIASASAGAYYYHTSTQKRLAEYATETAQLSISAKQNELLYKSATADAKRQGEMTLELIVNLRDSTKQRGELVRKLHKHDLTRLSVLKPGLIEKRINNATKKVFDQLESDTAI